MHPIQHQRHHYKISILLLFLLIIVGWFPAQSQENTLSERLKQHVSILASDSLQGRGLGTDGKYLAKQYIIEQFREAGLKAFNDSYIQPFETRIGLAWVNAYNVVGYLPGNDPGLSDEYILIGAHYDHLGYTRENNKKTIFPGADDNASGVAGIIEIARYFADNPDQLKRSLIVVAFDAEESGLLGAKHFVEQPPVALDKIKKMFSLDMIGMYEANRGVDLRGIASLDGGEINAMTVGDRQDVSIRRTGSNIARRTDTAPFGDKGIPATHVFTGTKSPYHKPTDTYDLLDYEGMAKVVMFSSELISQLSAETDLIADASLIAQIEQAETKPGRRRSAGITLHTGSGYHTYTDEFFRANSVFNVSTGLYAHLPLSKLLVLQPELLYDFNGSEIDGGNFRRHSITVPLNIQFGTPTVDEVNARAFLFGGAYFRYSFAGTSAGTTIDFDGIYEPTEWGFSAGAGLQLFRFQISYTIRKALTGILQNNEPEIFDNNGLFTVAFRL